MNTFMNSGGTLLLIAIAIIAINRLIWIGLGRKWTSFQTVIISTVSVFGFFLVLGLLAEGMTDYHPISNWNKSFEQSLTITMDLYRQLGWKAQELQRAAKLVRIFFEDAVFAWLMICIGLLATISYFLQRRLIPQRPGSQVALKPIELWSVPPLFIWVTIEALLFMGIGTRWLNLHWLYLIGINQVVILILVYGLAGLGIAFYFINHRKWPPLAKFFLVLLMSLMPIVLFFIVFLGLANTWWDLRQLIENQGKKPND